MSSISRAATSSIAVNMSDFTSAAANNSMIVSHIVNGYFDQDQLVLDVIGYDFLFFNRFAADVILNKTARDHGPYAVSNGAIE